MQQLHHVAQHQVVQRLLREVLHQAEPLHHHVAVVRLQEVVQVADLLRLQEAVVLQEAVAVREVVEDKT